MGKGGLLGTLVNTQVSGACVGQAIGPAAIIGQTISTVGSGMATALLSGINGLVGSVVTLLPGGAGGGTTGGGGSGSGSGSGTGGGAGNPLLGPQLSGAAAGQGMGPGINLGSSVPSPDWFLPGSKGPIGSSAIPLQNVGGILFDNCNAELTDIAELSGVYWDAQASALVFVGKPCLGKHPDRFTLPVMDRDHLAVALRAYLAGQPIGVSIDPPAKYRDKMKQGLTPPDNTPMLVSYLGNTKGTLFGAIMFEADRLLKCLDKGTDNITKKPCRATVAGYVPLLEKIQPGDDHQTNVWHRFWFVIEKVELKHDAKTGSLAFGDVRLKLLTETEMKDNSGAKQVNPLDTEFCRHITEHYDEYAKDFPILVRLKELAKIAAIAKYVCGRHLPLDLAEIFASPLQHVDTPDTTPGISVVSRNVKVEHLGNAIRTHTVSLFGGVDMDPSLVVQSDNGDAARLQTSAEKSRPSQNTCKWAFHEGHSEMAAKAVRVGSNAGAFRESCDDHVFVGGEISDFLRLRRIYDSASLRKGDFGPGWSLWFPYSLSVISQGGKRAEVLTAGEETSRDISPVLVLHDYTKSNSSILRRVQDRDSNGRLAYCKVTDQSFEAHGVSFHCDPSFVVYQQNTSFLLDRDGFTFVFDVAGNLREVLKSSRVLIGYQRNGEQVRRILGPRNQSYEIEYEVSESGTRVARIKVSDGHVLRYEYDSYGCLARWLDGIKKQASYGYDTDHRLTEHRDAGERVIGRNVYDDFGRKLSGKDTVATLSGSTIRRLMDKGHLTQVRDEKGSCISYRYDTHDNLSKLEAWNAGGTRWEMTFDVMGRLTQFIGCNGLRWLISYDHKGIVNKVVDSQGKLREWGDGLHLVKVCDHRGQTQSAEYDAAGRIRCLVAPNGAAWTFDHDGGSVFGVKGPLGWVRSKMTKQLVDISSCSAIGVRSKYANNTRLGSLETRSTGRGRLRVEYDDTNGHVSRVRTEAGQVEYQTHDSLVIETQFT